MQTTLITRTSNILHSYNIFRFIVLYVSEIIHRNSGIKHESTIVDAYKLLFRNLHITPVQNI